MVDQTIWLPESAQCDFCDRQAVVKYTAVDMSEDVKYSFQVCAWGWREVQVRHRRNQIWIMDAERIAGIGKVKRLKKPWVGSFA